MRKTVLALTAALAFAAGGCTMGPTALKSTAIDYNHAIRHSANEQMLLNLVRLKYRDTPQFLEIGAVSAQFTFGSSANISGSIFENVGERTPPHVLGLGGRYAYDEKPTITYTPLQGEDFVQRLMSPLQIDALIGLYYSGWSIDRILRLSVQHINGVENAIGASGPTPDYVPTYAGFARVAKCLRHLQKSRDLNLGYESRAETVVESVDPKQVTGSDLVEAAEKGYKFMRKEGSDGLVLARPKKSAVLELRSDALNRPETRVLVQLLGLRPGRTQYDVTAGVTGGGPGAKGPWDSMAVNTRSLLGTFFYLSQAVEVPESHQKQGLVTLTRDEEGEVFEWSRVTGDLFRVHSSWLRPTQAAVAVRYRDYWFYIDDADLNSKSTFALLGQIFGLQSGQVKSIAPVLTLPIGG